MICSIHQPNYIPYIGLFHKILLSDVFVFYDIAQYTKGDFHNRNTIKGSNGPILLSLPVSIKLGQTIDQTFFVPKVLNNHWKTIEQSYKRSKYYEQYKDQIRNLFESSETNLSKYNIETITSLCNMLGITKKIVVLSEIMEHMESSSSQALVDICTLVGADTYISGSGGRGYIDTSIFQNANITLQFQDFHHPVYSQLWGDFTPYMSIVDLIFNEGPNSLSILESAGGVLNQ